MIVREEDVIRLYCDKCREEVALFPLVDVDTWIQKRGWVQVQGKEYCPRCKRDYTAVVESADFMPELEDCG